MTQGTITVKRRTDEATIHYQRRDDGWWLRTPAHGGWWPFTGPEVTEDDLRNLIRDKWSSETTGPPTDLSETPNVGGSLIEVEQGEGRIGHGKPAWVPGGPQ